jgi:HK97 family phage major capsid protein
MNLAQMIAKCLADMESLNSKIEAAETANDIAAKATHESEYNAKKKEFEGLKAKALRLQEITDAKKVGDEVNAKSQVVAPGALPTVAAKAVDHNAEENARVNVFRDYFCGKSLSDSQRDLLAPQGAWKSGAGGVAIPRSLARSIMPEAFRFGTGLRAKALPSTSAGSAGEASLFQPDFQNSLLQYQGEAPAIFPRAFKLPCYKGSILWPQLKQAAPAADGTADEFAEYGYVSCGWTAEGAEAPGAEAQFQQVPISTHELAARTEMSRQLIGRASVDIEGLLSELFRASMLHKIDQALINGNGSTRPQGVLDAGFAIGSVNRAVASQVSYADLVNVETKIAPQLRANAAWVINDNAMQYIKKILDSNGRPLFLPYLQSPQDMYIGTILGHPVVATQRMPDLGTSGDVVLGAWNNYIAPVEQEIVVMRSEHRKIEQGLMVYVVFMQVGGKPVQTRAFAKLN